MHEAWFLTSHGFASCGQKEIAFLLEKRIIEDVFPYEMLKVFRTLYSLILNQGELNVSDQLSFIFSHYLPISISTLLPSPSLQCLPIHIIFGSLHSISSLTCSPSSLLITCLYHLSLASLTFSAMSTTSHHLLISSFHNVSDQLF